MALSPSDIFLRDWLADFPFANEESYRHALELARFARRPRRGPGRAPIFVITGRAGVGKSLLAQVLTGGDLRQGLGYRAEDTEKAVGSMLAAGRHVLLFDNVDDITSLQVRILEDVATQDTFHVRAFGRASLVDVSTNGAVIVITANAGDIRPAFVGAFRGDVVEIALSRTAPLDVNTLKHRHILAFTEANEAAIDAALPRFLYHVEDPAEAIDLFERFEEVHGLRLGRVDVLDVVHASAPLAPMEPVTVGTRTVPRVYDVVSEEPLVYRWRTSRPEVIWSKTPIAPPAVITIGALDVFNHWAFSAGYLVEEETIERVVDFLANVRGKGSPIQWPPAHFVRETPAAL